MEKPCLHSRDYCSGPNVLNIGKKNVVKMISSLIGIGPKLKSYSSNIEKTLTL
jgi:hypothetical protein